MELIMAISGIYLLYLLQKYLYKKYWDNNLSVELKFSKESAYEGEEVSLMEVITNRKLLPLTVLQVKFMTTRYFNFKDTDNSAVSDNYYRNDMISVMMYQKLTKSLVFECTKRGYYTINRINIICSDMFFTQEEVASCDFNIQLYVYPKQIDFAKLEPVFLKILGTVITKRFINEDPFEFNNIREYQIYDNLKTINWKASAKTASLKVNVHDYTSSQQVRIYINTESEGIWEYDELKEESIRIAAALAIQLINQGVPVSVKTNARDIITKSQVNVPAGSGNNHQKTIQETLARIDLSLEPAAFVTGFQEEFENAANDDYMIIISTYQKDDLQQMLLEQIYRKKEYIWILPINHEITMKVYDELAQVVMPWELEQ